MSMRTLLECFFRLSQINEPFLELILTILYMVNTFRYGILGVSDINIVFALAAIFAFIIVLAVWASHLLNKGKGIRS